MCHPIVRRDGHGVTVVESRCAHVYEGKEFVKGIPVTKEKERLAAYTCCTPIGRVLMRIYIMVAFVFCGIYSSVAGGYDVDSFHREMKLAEQSPDRDSKVKHLRAALGYRPEHKENITIELRIGVLLSQTTPTPNQPLRITEALDVFKSICDRYEHMDYYDDTGPTSLDSPQGIMPRAAIYAGDINMNFGKDPASAQEYYYRAMKYLKETHEKRMNDLLSVPPPRAPDNDSPFEGGEVEKSKYESRVHMWQKRQEDARKGNVLNYLEMSSAKTVVKHYGLSYGPQSPQMVPLVMNRIIKDFPNTPMAKFAQEHIQRSFEMSLNEFGKETGMTEFDLGQLAKVDPIELGRVHKIKDLLSQTPQPAAVSSSSPPYVQSRGSVNYSLKVLLIVLGMVALCAIVGTIIWRLVSRSRTL